MKKLTLIIIGALSVALITATVAYHKERAERKRLNDNQTALMSQVDYWTAENEKSAADVLKLTLTVNELKNTNKQLNKTVEDLGIKLKRVQSASTSGTKTEIKIVTQIRDSIVYRDSIIAPIKIFDWNDAWVDVKGLIERDSVDLSFCSRDTLTTVVHKIPHKFWFIKWGCKAVKQTVVTSNPHSKITYNEYIELK